MLPSKYILPVVVAILISSVGWAQQAVSQPGATRLAIGGFGAFQWNLHSDFTALPLSIPFCTTPFTEQSGSGFTVAGHFQVPMSQLFGGQIRLGYSALNGTMTGSEHIGNVLDPQDNLTIPADVEHHYNAELGTFYLEPAIRVTPLENIPISINLGFNAGLLIRKSYTYSEQLVDASHVRFLGESDPRSRNNSSDAISQPNPLYLGAMGSLSADIPVGSDGSILISPEIGYVLGLTNITDNTSWKVSIVRFGLALKYAFPQSDPIPDPDPDPDPPIVKPRDTAIVDAVAIDSTGQAHPTAVIQVEGHPSTVMYPLVNAIFFDENQDRIPTRYKKLLPEQTATFNIESIPASTLDVGDLVRLGVQEEIPPAYYQLLNIVGQRMRDNPNATIKLIGYRTKHESGQPALAARRARVLREYLTDVWRISSDRIRDTTVAAGKYNEDPTKPFRSDVQQDFQRVEITSSLPAILDPIIVERNRVITPPSLRLSQKSTVHAGAKEWTLTVMHQGKPLFEKHGTGMPLSTVDVDLRGKQLSEGTISSRLEVRDSNGVDIVSEQHHLSVQKVVDDKSDAIRRDDYRILTFGFDEDKIDEPSRRYLEVIKDRVKTTSSIMVIGYADKIGETDSNKILSDRRTQTIKHQLTQWGFNVHSSAAGEKWFYNQVLPEGRFYNRFAHILVETPLSPK